MKSFLFYTIIIFSFFHGIAFSQGNQSKFEQTTPMYRDLTSTTGIGQHWHNGVFLYFWYGYSNGYMKLGEQGNSSSGRRAENLRTKSIYMNIDLSRLDDLKDDLKNDFRDGATFRGSYGRSVSPNTRSNIASTLYSLCNYRPGYTFNDMIEVPRHWQNWPPGYYRDPWNGNISDIDDARCDAFTEYCYEKHGQLVSRGSWNITQAGHAYIDAHNDLHNNGYNVGELCPKIQAGELGNDSYLSALSSNDPTITQFSVDQLGEIQSEGLQLNFKTSDDKSVKAFILIQVKINGESNWRILKDVSLNKWQFREKNLTDYSSGWQYDHFHVHWAGHYEGGKYDGTNNFNAKITAIDQGGNYHYELFSFSGTLPETSVNIVGPGSLDWKEQGTWTANVSYGSGSYNYEWRYRLNGTGAWSSVVGTSQTFTKTMLDTDFELQVRAYGNGDDLYETHYVYYGTFVPKRDSNDFSEQRPNHFSLAQNYPNPFNPETEIRFGLPEPADIKLTIINSIGVEVRTLVQGRYSLGSHSVTWNGQNSLSELVASGIYFYRLQAKGKSGKRFSKIMKMILMR